MYKKLVFNSALIEFRANKKLFIFLTLAFILATIVGTLSHELGHYTASKFLGYPASISYKSTRPDFSSDYDQITEIRKKYSNEIKEGMDYPDKKLYSALNKKLSNASYLITLAGLVQTILTGTLGLLLLLLFRNRIFKNERVSFAGWCWIFMTLFWLREPANLCMALAYQLFNVPHSLNGDEFMLSTFLDLPLWSIAGILAFIGVLVLIWVLYKLPKPFRYTFIMAAIVGGSTGAVLWFMVLGKLLLP